MAVFAIAWSMASIALALWALRTSLREPSRRSMLRAGVMAVLAAVVVGASVLWLRV